MCLGHGRTHYGATSANHHIGQYRLGSLARAGHEIGIVRIEVDVVEPGLLFQELCPIVIPVLAEVQRAALRAQEHGIAIGFPIRQDRAPIAFQRGG